MNKQTSILHYQKASSLPDISASLVQTKSALDYKELVAYSQRDRVRHLNQEIQQHEKDLSTLRSRRVQLERINDAVGDLVGFSNDGPKIERPDGPSFRKLRKAISEDRAVYVSDVPGDEFSSAEFEKEVMRHAEILVVEHDWAAAFKGSNIDDAVIRLPFDVCAFEFKFSGRPVIAFAVQLDTEIMFCPAVLCGEVWAINRHVIPLNFHWADPRLVGIIELAEAVVEQIKAACIAIDADVAESKPVREAYSGPGSASRAQPLKPHHIVSLVRRKARAPLLGASDGTGKRKRLHFRRGHWRHFEDHRTWIKWMLVGDPDLGFVEKEYRL